MPEPRFRSRSYRRVKKKLPGGSTITQYKKRRPQIAKCAKCGSELKGIPRERPHKMQKLGVTKKRPERPYGGNLCSNCSQALIKKEARE